MKEPIALKRQGLHIGNSFAQLEAIIPYFRDPQSLRLQTQSHNAHERRALCSALTTLQFQANGDVTVCALQPPVGKVRRTPIRRPGNHTKDFQRSRRIGKHYSCGVSPAVSIQAGCRDTMTCAGRSDERR